MSECFLGGGGLNVTGWTGTPPSYLATATLSYGSYAFPTQSSGTTQKARLLTIDCPEAVTITATVTTTHDNNYVWGGSNTHFAIYDSSMNLVCNFVHTDSAGTGTFTGTVSIALVKGVNYLYFVADPPQSDYGRGFASLAIALGNVYPILSQNIKFNLKTE